MRNPRAIAVRLRRGSSCPSVALACPSPANATFPSTNGRIAFINYDNSLTSMRIDGVAPDGTGHETLSDSVGFVNGPAWSPDGDQDCLSWHGRR